MFISQLNIMLRKSGFKVGFTLMMLFVMYAFVSNFWHYAHDDIFMDISDLQAADRTLLNETSEIYGMSKLLGFIFPFVVVLPFSFSLFIDRSTKLSELVISRGGKRRYYFSKLFAAFTGSFAIFFIPLLISSTLTHIFYSPSVINVLAIDYSTLTAGGKAFFSTDDLMLELTAFSPIAGELFAALILSAYAGVCAMLALAVSEYIRRFSVLIFVPVFMLCKLFELWESMIKVDHGYMYLRVDPLKYAVISTDNIYYGRAYLIPFAEIAAIAAVSVLMTAIASGRDHLNRGE